MGLLVRMVHGQTPNMLVRRIDEVWILQGLISITVWMPWLSRAERLNPCRTAGPIPGWREALRTLEGMGVDTTIPAEEVPCGFGDGTQGLSSMWPLLSGVKPLPGGKEAWSSWDQDPVLGAIFRVTALDPDVTPNTLLWHVGFTTTAAAAEVDRMLSEVTTA